MNKLPISVIFLTLNEEFHIKDAIENVKPWAKNIFVVDSLSSDKTVKIAMDLGATVVQRPFTNFGDQWNYALQNLPIDTSWTMKMDPDERVTKSLLKSISDNIDTSNYKGFSFERRLWFMGKALHVYNSVTRIWKTGACKFTDVEVNEHPIINGDTLKISGFLEHLDSINLHHWYSKQNHYSTLEAIMKYKKDKLAAKPDFFGNKLERTMFYKKYFYALPFRYFFLWVYLYLNCRAWKDGYIGRKWIECRLEYYRMIEKKYMEIQMTEKIPENIKHSASLKFNEKVIDTKLQKKFLPDYYNKETSNV